MSANKSGVKSNERTKTLTSLGFQFLRNIDGSHEMWEHPEIKRLAETYQIEVPANIKVRAQQTLGNLVITGNPAPMLWKDMIKYATWCQQKAEAIKKNPGDFPKKSQVASQFAKTAPPPAITDKPRKGKPRHDTSRRM